MADLADLIRKKNEKQRLDEEYERLRIEQAKEMLALWDQGQASLVSAIQAINREFEAANEPNRFQFEPGHEVAEERLPQVLELGVLAIATIRHSRNGQEKGSEIDLSIWLDARMRATVDIRHQQRWERHLARTYPIQKLNEPTWRAILIEIYKADEGLD